MHLGIQASLGSTATNAVDDPLVNNTYSLAFDGTNDYMDITSLGALTGQLTWSVWAKKGDDSTTMYMLGRSSAVDIFELNNNESVRVRIANNHLFTTAGTVSSITDWHHYVATRDGSNMLKIYVDKVEKGIWNGSAYVTGGVEITGTSNIDYIARDSSVYFEGNIDEVAIWDTALTSTEISAIYDNNRLNLSKDVLGYESSSDLQGWWRMGDGTLDDSGTGIGNGLIADQVNATLGSEAFGDPSFEDASYLTFAGVGAGETLDVNTTNAGKMTAIQAQDVDLTKAGILVAGQLYRLEFVVDSISTEAGSEGRLRFDRGYTTWFTGPSNTEFETIDVGTWVFYAYAVNTNFGLRFDITSTFTMTSMSIKPVNGNAGVMINMTASDKESEVPS